MNITLPLQNSNTTVRLDRHARELLEDLKKTSTGANKANEQLQAGYQRLWDSGALTRFEEIRIRLFRFVLCAFQALELSTVTHALRIGIEKDGESSYQEDILVEHIDKLCSNFLSKDVSGRLSWTHGSARAFVVRVILDPGIGFEGTSAEETSMKSSHLLVANTFIAVMKDSDHQVWKELDLDPSLWKLQKQDSSWRVKALVTEKIRHAQSSLEYLGEHGWRHCELAADKYVISDPLWTRVLRELLLHPKTAFALWWRIWFRSPLTLYDRHLENILGDYAGERVILISHPLVFLKLKTDSVWDVQLEKAAKAPPERSTEEDLVESLVRHAACKSLNGANVLHLACWANNGSILKFMLQAILQRHGGVARVFELLEEEYKSQTPFVVTCARHRYHSDVWEILLRFENGCDQSSNRARSLCLWSQSQDDWGGRTALMKALETLEENEVIRLLDIHKPCDIDVQNGYRMETVLHIAVMWGMVQLVKVLVGKCHAKLNVHDRWNRTPLVVARHSMISWPSHAKFASTVEYLESIS